MIVVLQGTGGISRNIHTITPEMRMLYWHSSDGREGRVRARMHCTLYIFYGSWKAMADMVQYKPGYLAFGEEPEE
jgi:hypothetical protein